MSDKKTSRLRRAKRSRMKMRELGMDRLVINRSSQHVYAQLVSADNGNIVVSASTVEKDYSGPTGNKEAAATIGKLIAERAKDKGISKVAFDRSGHKYHGRVKALAEAARENGLEF
ncbi:MAG: 50S ribosomal protein L18 [Pseudomonadales bacterium]|nr:50S ribosomal protein L18 [Pseudomonadales bacterium]